MGLGSHVIRCPWGWEHGVQVTMQLDDRNSNLWSEMLLG